ncbi:TetR/AcrR family transcriptional regulator [Alcaligenaceae bacterium]|nr:TetR/AcrR family transcriptional regulator [Alcaligenaceae bacterium]
MGAEVQDVRRSSTTKRRVGRPPLTKDPKLRILEAAARQFAQKGYESSSLGDLAESLGVSKAAIYHYFSTKQKIYDVIILNALSGLVNAVYQDVAEQSTPYDRLRAFMTAHARYFEAHYNEFVVMLVGFSGMSVLEMKYEAVRLRDKYEDLLRSIIEQGVQDGSFAQSTAVTARRGVLSVLSWMARWYSPTGTKSAEKIALEYFDLLTQGMNPRMP